MDLMFIARVDVVHVEEILPVDRRTEEMPVEKDRY